MRTPYLCAALAAGAAACSDAPPASMNTGIPPWVLVAPPAREPAPEVKPSRPARHPPLRAAVRPAPPPAEEPAPELPPLTDAAFHSAVTSWAGLRHCLSAKRGDAPSGAISVALTIDPSGSVLDSEIAEATTAAARAISPCVRRHSRLLRFPTFASTEPVTRHAKFVF